MRPRAWSVGGRHSPPVPAGSPRTRQAKVSGGTNKGHAGDTVARPGTRGRRGCAVGAIFISGQFHAMEFNYEFDCFLGCAI